MFKKLKRLFEPIEVLWYCRHCMFVKKNDQGKMPKNFESYIDSFSGNVHYFHKQCCSMATRWKQI